MYDSDCANDSFLQSAVKPVSGAKDSTMTVGFPGKTTDIFYAGAQHTVTFPQRGKRVQTIELHEANDLRISAHRINDHIHWRHGRFKVSVMVVDNRFGSKPPHIFKIF